MPIEGFPPVSHTPILAPISDWGSRLVAPLGSSLMSKDERIELAGRVYWIVGLVIAAVLVARKYGYLIGRVTPPDSSPINIGDGIGEIDAELNLENSAEDSIEDFPMMQGDIVDDASQDEEVFVGNLPNQQIEQELVQHQQLLNQHRQEIEQIRWEMEQRRRERDQHIGQMMEQMEQMVERMDQRLEQIERQLRGPTETEQSR